MAACKAGAAHKGDLTHLTHFYNLIKQLLVL